MAQHYYKIYGYQQPHTILLYDDTIATSEWRSKAFYDGSNHTGYVTWGAVQLNSFTNAYNRSVCWGRFLGPKNGYGQFKFRTRLEDPDHLIPPDTPAKPLWDNHDNVWKTAYLRNNSGTNCMLAYITPQKRVQINNATITPDGLVHATDGTVGFLPVASSVTSNNICGTPITANVIYYDTLCSADSCCSPSNEYRWYRDRGTLPVTESVRITGTMVPLEA